MTDPTAVSIEELARKFDRLSDVVDGESLLSMLVAMALIFERAIKEKIKERGLIDSGRLRSSVGWLKLNDKTVAVGVFNLIYAAIHEFGGVIKAKGSGYLRFKTKDGRWHAVKEVNMPARPYVRPAFYEKIDEALAEFGRLMVEHFERIARS